MNKSPEKSPGPPPIGKHPGPRFNGPAEKAKNQKATLKRIWLYLKNQKIGIISSIFFVVFLLDH